MNKIELKPQTLLFPLPAVMVSVGEENKTANIITISWIGIVCSKPPMLSISVTPERYSYGMIKKAGNFVVNLTGEQQLKETDFCGTRSGRDYNKFEHLSLTPSSSSKISSPRIEECPINLECEVKQSILLGSHEMFIAEIVAVHAGDEFMNDRGRPDLDKIKPLVYCPGAQEYRGGLIELLGRYGEPSKK